MGLYPNQSLYTTINVNDHEPFIVGDSIISYTFEYIYVGSPISNATIAHQVKSHIKLKQSHVRIFTSFVSKDVDAPYKVKKVVWESALKGSIFYSCESWMYENLKSASQPYLTTQTLLLGVHSQTCTDLVVPSNKPLIWKKFQNVKQMCILKNWRTYMKTPLPLHYIYYH